MRHWAQMVQSKRFQEYDYGSVMNQRLYGSSKPPEIDISNVKNLDIPIIIFYGRDDTIVYAQDTLWLKGQLGHAVKDMIEVDGGHLAYFIRNDASYLNRVFKYFDQYNGIIEWNQKSSLM